MGIFDRIEELLAAGESFVLAVIVSRSGSAPRAVGTRMIIRRDGSIMGTIGGGILEARVQDLARSVFDERKSVVSKFVLSAEDASRMGMICGGQVQVFTQFVDASQISNLRLCREILTTLRSRKRAWLITEIPSNGLGQEAPEQVLVRSDGSHGGRLDSSTVEALTAHASVSQPELIPHQDRRFLVESLCHEGTVFIFGAGHISQKLAPLTGLVGFQTVVLDDRHEFANRERFETADDVIVLDTFERAMDGLEIDEDSYLVLVTRGHSHDKTVLKQALETRAGYIGMIGSRRKRDAIYDALCKEGLPRQELARVCSPIGLDIGAETPEEIAVSIAAELIQVRAERNK
jgi:xanthine dehydrogenase accessory factor